MRVYISVDMEGVAGVVHEDQTDSIDPRHAGEYNRFRRLMLGEANAAIEGALAAGADPVLVNDSYWWCGACHPTSSTRWRALYNLAGVA